MPELRNDPAAGRMHLVDHILPPGEGGIAEHSGHPRVVDRGRMVDGNAFGDDQAGPAGCPSPVVAGDIGAGNSCRRRRPRHRRHDDPVLEFQGPDGQRLEQGSVMLGHRAHRAFVKR